MAKLVKILVAAALMLPVAAEAEVTSQSRSMTFDQCLAVIAQTATELGVAPINIAETTQMRIVRFPTADGSVLVTCSAPDQKMVVTKSTN
jgi:hypothetical protein